MSKRERYETSTALGVRMEEEAVMVSSAIAEYAVQMAGALARVAGELPYDDGPEMDIKARMKKEGVDIETEPYKTMIEVVGEYEHGSADCPILTELYAVATADMIMCLHYIYKDMNPLHGQTDRNQIFRDEVCAAMVSTACADESVVDPKERDALNCAVRGSIDIEELKKNLEAEGIDWEEYYPGPEYE